MEPFPEVAGQRVHKHRLGLSVIGVGVPRLAEPLVVPKGPRWYPDYQLENDNWNADDESDDAHPRFRPCRERQAGDDGHYAGREDRLTARDEKRHGEDAYSSSEECTSPSHRGSSVVPVGPIIGGLTLQITECKRLPQKYAKASIDGKPLAVKEAPAFCIRYIWLFAFDSTSIFL